MVLQSGGIHQETGAWNDFDGVDLLQTRAGITELMTSKIHLHVGNLSEVQHSLDKLAAGQAQTALTLTLQRLSSKLAHVSLGKLLSTGAQSPSAVLQMLIVVSCTLALCCCCWLASAGFAGNAASWHAGRVSREARAQHPVVRKGSQHFSEDAQDEIFYMDATDSPESNGSSPDEEQALFFDKPHGTSHGSMASVTARLPVTGPSSAFQRGPTAGCSSPVLPPPICRHLVLDRDCHFCLPLRQLERSGAERSFTISGLSGSTLLRATLKAPQSIVLSTPGQGSAPGASQASAVRAGREIQLHGQSMAYGTLVKEAAGTGIGMRHDVRHAGQVVLHVLTAVRELQVEIACPSGTILCATSRDHDASRLVLRVPRNLDASLVLLVILATLLLD